MTDAASPAAAAPEPIELNIIRWWPDGFAERLEHVWRDLVGFIPNYKLHDLQRMLAEFGFTMVLYEAASPVAPVGAPTGPTNEELERLWETTHYGHPADFAADVLERWGGWPKGMLGYGGSQGCELATDATKQLGEHSAHPALSTSSVPTAAPLPSPPQIERTELPRGLSEHLRDQCAKLRTKSTPLSDLIPLMQQAADSLDAGRKLRLGVRQITSCLENKEWADLLTTDPDLADLEEAVGKLVGTR